MSIAIDRLALTEMIETRLLRRLPTWRLYSIYLLAAIALSIGYTLWRHESSTFMIGATLPRLLSATAEIPFQYRVLVPWIVNLLGGNVSLFWVIEAMATFCLLLSFLFLLRTLQPSIHPLWSFSILYGMLTITVLSPVKEARFFYPWDTPSVAFTAAGLALLYRKDWRWVYPLFFIATLNRETTYLLIGVCLLWAPKHALGLSAIWVSVKGFLWLLYNDNPGYPVHFALPYNLELLSMPGGVSALLLATGGLVYISVPLHHYAPRFLRYAMLVAAGHGVLLFLTATIIVEQRSLGEVIPILTATVATGASSFAADIRARMSPTYSS